MDPRPFFLILASMALLAAFLVYRLPLDRCPHTCVYCRDLQAKADADRAERQKELYHDSIHRGYGLMRRPVDTFDCADPTCQRNRKYRKDPP